MLFSIFVLLFPFKIKIYNRDNYLFINIANFIDLKLNLLVLLENIDGLNIEKQKKNARVLKKIEIKEINLRAQGLNFNYQINGAYYGIIYAVVGFLNYILNYKGISFRYDLEYSGDKSIEFKSIIRARVGYVLSAFIKL